MCGIGVVFRRSGPPIAASVVEAMTAAVRHRGPDGGGETYFRDGHGTWSGVDSRDDWRLALGHRRLAILDVTAAGRQPMSYRDRLWITYNGEVYNYLELRRELSSLGHAFHTGTDTEVILAAYAEWGPSCFARFRGMWGLAIVDLAARQLIVSRDRLGIKPMFRYETASAIYFVSEIKQLRAAGLSLRPNEAVLREYLRTGYESIESTFFDGVHPVPAGTWTEIDLQSGKETAPQSYWHPESIQPTIFDADEASDRIRAALAESCKLQLRSDVPVGCALSGGLDSGSIAALVSREPEMHERLNTFTVAFPGTPIDESRFAALVAQAGNMQPHVVIPTANEFLHDLDDFLWSHDEPVGSLSQYAGFALARLTRAAGVPVTLNGQGGDETLSGYWQSYFSYLYEQLRRLRVPFVTRHLLGSLFPRGNSELFRQLPAMWRRYQARTTTGGSLVQRALRLDSQQRRVFEIRELHLPRLLKWDDRNLMAFSIEGRYPFLDHEFIEVALSCDESVFYRRGWTKEPLRRGMHDVLPAELLRRRDKNGFETPQAAWICGPLRTRLQSWLGDDGPLWNYVPPADARRVGERTWNTAGADVESSQALMRLFFADGWLRVCGDGESKSAPHSQPAIA